MRIPRGGGNGIVVVLVVAIVVLLADALEGDRDDGSGDAGSGRAGETARVDVLRIVDGDTIEVDLDGRTEDVRYIGIDTPESVKPGTPVECFGKEAAEANRELVEGREVRLVFDRELRDRFGRLLAYVYAGDEFVNASLIERGFATTLEIAPNTSMAAELERLERRASIAGAGLWSSC
jgi:micrococcal nuclease